MTDLTTLLLLLAFGAGMFAWWSQRTPVELAHYCLSFPGDLAAADVAAFLAGLSERRRFTLLTAAPTVIVETTATAAGITHRLMVPKSSADQVLGQLRAAAPGVRAVPEGEEQPLEVQAACEYRLTSSRRPLRVDQRTAASVSASLLAAFLPLEADERVVVQWIVRPAAPPQPIKPNAWKPSRTSDPITLIENIFTSVRDQEQLQAERRKQSAPLFQASLRLGVSAAPHRRRHLLWRLGAPLAAATNPGVHFVRRLLPESLVVRRLTGRIVPAVEWPIRANADELSGLIGFPLDGPALPGLSLAASRLLPPPSGLATDGLTVARSNFPGTEGRPLALGMADALSHIELLGSTGSGKSTVALSLLCQAARAGHGVAVFDPNGDLADDFLNRIPPWRVKDVVLIDPLDPSPIGINPLQASGNSDLACEQIIATFKSVFGPTSFGPRSEDTLRCCLRSLAAHPDATLVDVPLLLTNENYRRQVVAGLTDSVLLQQWQWYETLSASQRAEVIGPLLNKIRSYSGRPVVRAVIGQSRGLDFGDVLANQRILICRLPKGLLGDAATILGNLILGGLWAAGQQRAGVGREQRPPTLVVLDEFQDWLGFTDDIETMLVQARKYGLGLVLSHQSLFQLDPALRPVVTSNARSKVIFTIGGDDARLIARDWKAHLNPADLTSLARYEVVAQLLTNNQVMPPATGVTAPPPPTTGRSQAARAWSRQHYGRARGDVEAELADRQRSTAPDTPIRSRRRS